MNSEKAIQLNIIIIRTFVLVRQHLLNYEELQGKIKKLEKKYNKSFNDIYKVLDLLLNDKQQKENIEKRERIGFKK